MRRDEETESSESLFVDRFKRLLDPVDDIVAVWTLFRPSDALFSIEATAPLL
jgi:hypothetical protein